MITRRGFLGSILAAGVAPAIIPSGVLMPMRRIILPYELSPTEARQLLGTCDMRYVRTSVPWWHIDPKPDLWLDVEVKIYDRWMHLGRTDLYDNVATYNSEDGKRSLESTRMHYLSRIHDCSYVPDWKGARINEWSHGASFSVIDAISDG